MVELIAFSGYARSGKDTAQSLLAKHGYDRVAFADMLRNFLVALDPVIATNGRYAIRVSEVINHYGWDGYKSSIYGTEIRGLLQRLGTEAGRNLLGDNIWIDAALNSLQEGKYCVTDCRFINEADAVRARGGKVIRINRTGVGPANEHISETGLDDYVFDAVIDNDGSLEEYEDKLWHTVQSLRDGT